MLTIRRHKGNFEQLSVAIVGDILHSRVARSNMLALKTLGCPDIRVIALRTLLPIGLEEQYGVRVFTNADEGLKNVDVVIMLRLQRERMQGGLLPSEGEFFKLYGLTEKRLKLAKPDAIVMHPGPINRGVEIESAVADGAQSVILNQVTYGIAIRMAVLSHGHERPEHPTPAGTGGRRMTISIRGARVIDPASGLDQVGDLHIEAGKIVAIGAAPAGFSAQKTLDGAGLVAAPGLVDLSVALREPGYGRKGNVESETRAAAAGGTTSLCCPPYTRPVLDTPAVAELILDRAREAGNAKVYPIGALTRGFGGEQLSELVALRDTGCVAFTNGLHGFASNRILRRALEYAATFDLTVIFTSQDTDLAEGGLAHEGPTASFLGLAGIPETAETVALARNLLLVEQSGVRALQPVDQRPRHRTRRPGPGPWPAGDLRRGAVPVDPHRRSAGGLLQPLPRATAAAHQGRPRNPARGGKERRGTSHRQPPPTPRGGRQERAVRRHRAGHQRRRVAAAAGDDAGAGRPARPADPARPPLPRPGPGTTPACRAPGGRPGRRPGAVRPAGFDPGR